MHLFWTDGPTLIIEKLRFCKLEKLNTPIICNYERGTINGVPSLSHQKNYVEPLKSEYFKQMIT